MTTAADRRRRPFALAVALLVVALGLVVGSPAAHAAPCGLLDTTAACVTTSTTESSTSTTDRSTTTTEEDSGTDGSTSHPTSTTQRRSTTTTRDDVTTTTGKSVTVSTVTDLLVPGDGTEGAESTTTTAKALATGSSGLSDDQLIVLVVGGLGVVALVIGFLTWRYWSATRPVEDEPPARAGR